MTCAAWNLKKWLNGLLLAPRFNSEVDRFTKIFKLDASRHAHLWSYSHTNKGVFLEEDKNRIIKGKQINLPVEHN